ncbi:MAG: alpha/beta hydrolase-fold protein [Betaproteobacteria bacterium]
MPKITLLTRGLTGLLLTWFALLATASAGPVDQTLPWVTREVQAPRVVYRTFDSRTVGAKVSYHAYLPQGHDGSDSRWPVLYWLHGTEGGVSGIRPLARLFDEAMEAGRMPAMIVVFVNGLPRRLWADSKDGSSPVETVFIQEVIPEVDRTFRTIASREGRLLEGFSMGGYGAARLGFGYPHLFAGISILAGGPLDLELRGPRAQHSPQTRQQLLREVCSDDWACFRALSPLKVVEAAAPVLRAQPPVVRQAVGMLDDTRDLNRQFHERIVGLGIAHDYVELPGVRHDPQALLQGLLALGDGFYRRALNLAEPAARK